MVNFRRILPPLCSRALPLALIALSLLSGCESQREFSGIWREACDDDAPCADGDIVFELHLGRYGDAVAGLAVQYVYTPDLMTFARPNDCGCFFIESGSAGTDRVGFRLRDPDEPGFPDADNTRAESCVANPPPPCMNGIVALRGTEDRLEGTLSCDGLPDRVMHFTPAKGTPRRICVAPDA